MESALLFLTGDGPARAGTPEGTPMGTRPLLGAYKAWVGETLVGIGPGRSKCGLGGNGTKEGLEPLSPILCPHGVERVFDGYDVTAILSNCGASCSLFIEAYGYDQPVSATQPDAVYRRVAAELVVRYSDGTSWNSAHGANLGNMHRGGGGIKSQAQPLSPVAWLGYDADAIFLQNLWEVGGGGHSHQQLGSSGGGAWYYAPHEYIDMSRMPVLATPLHYPGAGSAAHNDWRPVAPKPTFDNLVVRPVPPMQLLSKTAALEQLGPGLFFFDMGREIQVCIGPLLPPPLPSRAAYGHLLCDRVIV